MYFNTYVINLDSQKKRYEVQEKKLNEVGIYPTRISGYMYDDISEIEIKKHFDFIFHRNFIIRYVIHFNLLIIGQKCLFNRPLNLQSFKILFYFFF